MNKHITLARLLASLTIILLCTVAGQSQILNKIGKKTRKAKAGIHKVKDKASDAGSAANLYREAHGLNKQGTVITRVSMFGNRYNMQKAMKFWGAEKGYGAQIPVKEK